MAKNERAETISFTVDHAFVEMPSVISEEKPISQNTILMMVIHDFQIAMHLLPSTLCNRGTTNSLFKIIL